MREYLYAAKNPIFRFDKLIGKTNRVYKTIAASKKEAARNICFQIKRELKLEAKSKISIDTKYIISKEI